MIKLLSCEAPGHGYTKPEDVIVAGAIFDLNNNNLVLSFPEDDYAFTGLVNDRLCVLWRYENNKAVYRFFDYTKNTFLDELPSEELIFKLQYPDGNYVVFSDETENTTVIKNLNGKILLRLEEYLGSHIEMGNYLYFSGPEHETCIDIDKRTIIWQVEQPGELHIIPGSDWLLFWCDPFDRYETILTLRNRFTGEFVKEKPLPYNTRIRRVLNDKLILTAYHKDDNFVGHHYILQYELNTDKVKELELELQVSDIEIIDNYYYHFLREPEYTQEVTARKDTFIRRYDLETGESRGELLLPNVRFESSPSFYRTSTGMGALGGCLPWFEEYKYLIFWDEEDFDNPNPEIYEEPLFGKSERLMDHEQSCYRVHIEQDCENYFQLHHQLSVALHRTATMNGGNLNYPEKTKDKAFHGKIICDVSNHTLSEQEKFAVIHMCEHLEAKLLLWYFRAGNSNKQQIEMEPKFD